MSYKYKNIIIVIYINKMYFKLLHLYNNKLFYKYDYVHLCNENNKYTYTLALVKYIYTKYID